MPAILFAAPSVGKAAPDFKLKAQDGKMYELSQFKGKNVVLEWYNKDCPYVKKHYMSKHMQGLQEKFTKQGVVWLSIISSAKGNQGYLDAKGAMADRKERGIKSTATLFDADGKVGKLYAAKTTPHMFVINAKGTLVYEGAIDDNDSADSSSLKGAKNYVEAALMSTLKGEPVKVAQSKPYGCSVKYK